MKEQLTKLNHKQFEIDITNNQIQKVKTLIMSANKCRREALETELSVLLTRLSNLKRK
jgi:hypothetical protein